MKKLTCHCKGVEITVILKNDLKNIVRCNCSICKRKGSIMTMVGPEDFKIIKGLELLTEYQFHSKVAKHFFCSICGIYTHHNPRKDPSLFGINVGCLEESNAIDSKDVKILDGANHPLDKK